MHVLQLTDPTSSDTAPLLMLLAIVIVKNILACVMFNLMFSYLLPGWEGSAADSRIWHSARSTDLRIPEGTYYLGDAGFPSCDSLLVPYRGVRYHLREFAQGNQKPANHKELFNLRHASLRNVVERAFGVLKRKFPLPANAPEFDIDTQSKLVCAVGALFNAIRKYAPDTLSLDFAELAKLDSLSDEAFLAQLDAEDLFPTEDVSAEGVLHESDISTAEKNRAEARRDRIAKAMWVDYVQILRERGERVYISKNLLL
ncbi:hypothetical protein EUX98_g9758 [Antrodiella citrinella]|uniref:DDE Tnp4 domain-containing protein n=1 Tax=Antrodiella citrinella TaxID=2447956 RepID=A0A4S4LNM0_9APHY|nr:hypothetical protein EUX98_g9758 [Antrodiella citrinella]